VCRGGSRSCQFISLGPLQDEIRLILTTQDGNAPSQTSCRRPACPCNADPAFVPLRSQSGGGSSSPRRSRPIVSWVAHSQPSFASVLRWSSIATARVHLARVHPASSSKTPPIGLQGRVLPLPFFFQNPVICCRALVELNFFICLSSLTTASPGSLLYRYPIHIEDFLISGFSSQSPLLIGYGIASSCISGLPVRNQPRSDPGWRALGSESQRRLRPAFKTQRSEQPATQGRVLTFQLPKTTRTSPHTPMR
jgi:hypothetical protein